MAYNLKITNLDTGKTEIDENTQAIMYSFRDINDGSVYSAGSMGEMSEESFESLCKSITSVMNMTRTHIVKHYLLHNDEMIVKLAERCGITPTDLREQASTGNIKKEVQKEIDRFIKFANVIMPLVNTEDDGAFELLKSEFYKKPSGG